MAIQLAMRHFNEDFNGRRLIIFSDHRPLIGTFDSNDLQAHDPLAQNAINEISQFTSDIRFKPGKDIPVADWLSRPDGQPIGESVDVTPPSQNIKYVPPEAPLAASEACALQTLSPSKLSADQQSDESCQAHLRGDLPKNVTMSMYAMAGGNLICETSDPNNPRPMIPLCQRNLGRRIYNRCEILSGCKSLH